MGVATGASVLRVSSLSPTSCRLLVKGEGHIQVIEFIVAGLEAGQQVLILGAPDFLKQIGQQLGDIGHKPEALLRNERLVFLTAPECFPTLDRGDDPFHRLALHRNGSPLRWVSEWSWLRSHGVDLQKALCYQRRIHDLAHSLGAISLCTADSAQVERSSLLAMMANHRRSGKPNPGPC